MKKLFFMVVLCVSALSAGAQNNAQSLLQQLLGNDATAGTLKNILEDVVGGAVSKLDLSIDGTWKYSEPEMQFKSDKLLAQAGGAAATARIEASLAKFYGKIGMNESLSYTFNSDSTFVQTIKLGKSEKSLKGTYSLDKENKIITFKYSALGLGKVSAIYANTGTSLALMFDATQLLNFLKKLSSLVSSFSSGKTGLTAVTVALSQYDGWKYSEPEMQFKSDKLLAQAGGAAATARIEASLAKFYGKIGMNESLSYTFNSDSTFVQTIKLGKSEKSLKGTYSLDKENKIITFKYSALGLGKVSAIYANTGTSLALMFDATQLLNFLKKLSSLVSSFSSGKTGLTAVTVALSQYDGALLGYKMTRANPL